MLYANLTGQWMFLAGLVLLAAIMLRRFFRYQRALKREERRASGSPRPTPVSSGGVAGQPLADAPTEVLRWQVEMHETARDLKAELDTKLSALQTLVRMADERISQLKELEQTEQNQERSQGEYVSERRSTSELADARVESVLSHRRPLASELHGLPGDENLRRSIYQLADRGLDPRRISEDLGQALGDVELVLSLRSVTPVEGV